ncbi:hypothetical protein CCH79_00017718, partial [Gambusia affinis]
MTDSCLNQTDLRRLAEDGKSKLSAEFIPSAELPHSCIEDKEHLQVYLRIRPLTSAERSNGESQDCVAMETPDTVLLKPPSLSLLARLSSDKSLPQTGQRFQFSRVFGPETTQSELFEGTVKDLVKDVLEGENSLVFTYGVTNSGKTFTFLGTATRSPDSVAEAGILPRALRLIFSSIGDNVFQGLSVKPHRCREFLALSRQQQADEALFKKSLLKQLREVSGSGPNTQLDPDGPSWNEKSSSLQNATSQTWFEAVCRVLEGLLSAGSTAPQPNTAAQDRIILDIKPNTKFSVWVSFCEIYNENIHDLLEVAPSGVPRRPVLRLAQDANSNPYRCAKTQNKGERLKEAGNINASLLILGKCIKALRYNQQAKLLQHIPFRESKLTHYLQGFFCGRGRACMIVNINQCASMYDETLNVLKFSAVAQKVRTVVLSVPMERSENLLLEARVREEISREFSVLFADMQKDYDERLVREREILEERAERRLEIFKNLTRNMSSAGCSSDTVTMDRFLSCQASELPGASHFSLGSGPTEKKPEDGQNHEHRADEAEEKKWLLHQLQEKSVQVAQLEQQLEDLKKKTELGSQNSSERGQDEDQLQEALAALQKEQTKREELIAALEYQTLGKEEALASLQEERRARQEVQSALEESRRQQQESRVAERVEVQTAVHMQPAVEELEEKIQNQSYQIHVLTEELQQLKQLHAPVFSYSDGVDIQLWKEVSELSKRLEEEKKRSETKQKLIQQLDEERKQREAAVEQQVRELRRKLEEQEELLESQREASTQEAEQLQLKLRLQQEAAEKLRDDLRKAELHSNTASTSAEDLHMVNSDLRREITSLKEEASSEMEQMRREKDRQLEEKLAEMERRSAETEGKLLEELQEAERKVATLQKSLHQSEQKVVTLQENLDQSEQKVATLQEAERKVATLQVAEQRVVTLQENLHQSEQKVAILQEAERKVATLQENLLEAERKVATLQENLQESQQWAVTLQRKLHEVEQQVATFQEKLQEAEQKVTTLQEAEQKVTTLQEKLQEAEQKVATLQEAEQKVATLQEKLQEVERWEEEESLAVQEVRRKEVERRQELLAVAHEALAEKDAELEKKAGEISRLKLEAQEEAQQVKSLHLELQRKEDDSSDLREKLADYRKQVQQVQKEVSAMRANETALKQKLSDAEKTKKQLQSELSSRDRTIQQLRAEQQDSKAAQLYQEACKELQAKQQAMEDMRLALTEQEETQQQMEQVLDDKMRLMQELSAEVEKLKGKLLEQNTGSGRPSDDLGLARDEASRAQQSLKVLTEKQQAERRKWQEEKLSLIGQAKEAEDKRNQEMRKFAEDRERYCRQQSLLESRLEEKEAAMESWRAERDTLVAALEVQLQKLLASQADKDKLIKELQLQSAASPAGANGGRRSLKVAELRAALAEKEAEIVRLKENAAEQSESSALAKKAKPEPLQPERRETRSSSSSRGSSGFPSVLESSEVSTETGRTSRFPRPELEISFSPLQPNRLALRRQGDDSAVTVKINRTARKRKSSEMEKVGGFRLKSPAGLPERKQEEYSPTVPDGNLLRL